VTPVEAASFVSEKRYGLVGCGLPLLDRELRVQDGDICDRWLVWATCRRARRESEYDLEGLEVDLPVDMPDAYSESAGSSALAPERFDPGGRLVDQLFESTEDLASFVPGAPVGRRKCFRRHKTLLNQHFNEVGREALLSRTCQ